MGQQRTDVAPPMWVRVLRRVHQTADRRGRRTRGRFSPSSFMSTPLLGQFSVEEGGQLGHMPQNTPCQVGQVINFAQRSVKALDQRLMWSDRWSIRSTSYVFRVW